jgi:predicted anti-sigma-YlaC factor YlaD
LSPCDTLQAQAASLAALPATDPERIAAERHASDCEGCRQALDEGRRLLALLESLPEPAPPSPEVLRRAAEPILKDLRRPPHPLRWGNAIWNALPTIAVVATWVTLLARQHGVVVGLIGFVAFAAVRAAGGLGWLSTALIVATSLGLAASEGLHGLTGPLGGAMAFNCARLELVAAIFPLAAALLAPRITGRAPSAATCAAAAAAGALVGQGALHVLCPLNSSAPHILAFHVGSVLLAAGAGALASQLPILRPIPTSS